MAIRPTPATAQLTILTATPATGDPETVVAASSLFRKPAGFNTVELAITGTAAGPEDYELLRWWGVDQNWRPEGPRGATPTTFELTGTNSVPARISVPTVECFFVVLRTSANPGITNEKALVEAQLR
jgi:hypothetical protein